MGYVYKITNKINGKSYIGKTIDTIEKRFREHIDDSKRERCEIRPLYRAFNKYGIENFSIEEIERCPIEDLSKREQYWIEFYDTYNNGYNATLGGDGKILLDYDGIITQYLQLHNASEVARIMNCHVDSVLKILHINDIPVKNGIDILRDKLNKPILQYTKQGDFVKEYSSAMEAARALGNINYGPNIIRCANGKRKTANKYIWVWKK